jgi:hypothetical protein
VIVKYCDFCRRAMKGKGHGPINIGVDDRGVHKEDVCESCFKKVRDLVTEYEDTIVKSDINEVAPSDE